MMETVRLRNIAKGITGRIWRYRNPDHRKAVVLMPQMIMRVMMRGSETGQRRPACERTIRPETTAAEMERIPR